MVYSIVCDNDQQHKNDMKNCEENNARDAHARHRYSVNDAPDILFNILISTRRTLGSPKRPLKM